MIEIFKKTDNHLEKISGFEKNSWVYVTCPTNEEVETLSQTLNIPMDLLKDPLDMDERARTEVNENCILIVLRIPQITAENPDIPFITLPFGIVFTEDLMVTICLKSNMFIENIIYKSKVKDFSYLNRHRLIIEIFQKAAVLYLSYLKEINRKTSDTEKMLHKAMKNEELIELLKIEKSLVYFTTSLRSNELMMERLQKSGILKLDSEERELLEDVIIDNKQAIETSNIYSNILSGMMDAFASIISNNLAEVLKILTSFTIILMLPTLVASVYGMNIPLPFQHSPHAFMITMGISFLMAIISVIVFINRKWF